MFCLKLSDNWSSANLSLGWLGRFGDDQIELLRLWQGFCVNYAVITLRVHTVIIVRVHAIVDSVFGCLELGNAIN